MTQPSLAYDFGRWSDVGKRRPENEDECYVPDNLAAAQQRGWLFVVADGMGSYGHGRLAASTVISGIKRMYYDGGQPIVDSLAQANLEVFNLAQANPQYEGMGTTVVGALTQTDGSFQIFNVGDSRAYLIRNNQIDLISKDHSVVARRAEEQHISWEEAAKQGKTNQLTRSMGRRAEVAVEFLKPDYKPILNSSLQLTVGDALVLCSDGAWRDVKSDEIMRVVRKSRSAQSASEELVRLANDRGGSDNISVVVIKCLSSGIVVPIEPTRPLSIVPPAAQPAGGIAEPVPSRAQPRRKSRGVLVVSVLALMLVAILGVAVLYDNHKGPSQTVGVLEQSTFSPTDGIATLVPTETSQPSSAQYKYDMLVYVGQSDMTYDATADVTLEWEPAQALLANELYRVVVEYIDARGVQQRKDLPSREPSITLSKADFFQGNQSVGASGKFSWTVSIVADTNNKFVDVSPPTVPKRSFAWMAATPTPPPLPRSTATTSLSPSPNAPLPATQAAIPTCPSGQFWDSVMNRCRSDPKVPATTPKPSTD